MEEFKKAAVYVMTSFTSPKKADGNGIWVFEFPREGKPAYTANGIVPLKGVTKNEASLLTLTAVLEKITEPVVLKVYLDDRWTADMISRNLSTWAANGFRKKDGEPVAHAEEWKQIHGFMKRHPVVTVQAAGEHSYKKWMAAELKRRKTA